MMSYGPPSRSQKAPAASGASERPPKPAPPSVETLAALVLAGGTGRRTTTTTTTRGPSALDAEHARKRRGPGRAPAGPPKLPDVRSRDDAWIRLAAAGPAAVRA